MANDARALDILEQALGLDDPDERAAFIARACGDDSGLRARVEHLLGFDESDRTLLPTGSFLRPLGVIEQIPEVIGPFRVTQEIARGGMGAVVKAERCDGMFEQTVAIKLIRGDLASARARERFAAERRILGRLHHPAIVRILDGGEVDGRPWLAMDFIDGLPVDEALERTGADRRTRLAAFVEVCEAVAYAARQLVVHADIKSSNVLMDEGGAVHLLDFGIARLIAEIDIDEAGDPYPLTRSFAAPERGVGLAPTVASDVYSLGVMLLVMLGLGLPPAEVAMVPGTRLPEGWLEGDLAAIAARALAEEPTARYPDAAALAQDVRRHLADQPVSVREGEGWRYSTGRFIRRHRKGLLLTGLVGTMLLATSIGASVQYFRAERARAEADARFDDARGVARYLIFDLIPALEDTPGSLTQRVAAAEVAERYLTRLAGARQASDALRLETAQGLLQLASLQARVGRPNLGLPEPAVQNLARADAIAAALPGDDALRLLARIRIERVRLATWMKADLAEAERLAVEAQASVDAARHIEPHLPLDLTLVLADLRGFQGRFADEERLAAEALAAMEPDRGGVAAFDRAMLLSLQAEGRYYAGRAADALPLYRQGLAIIERERAASGETPYVIERLTKAHWEVGTTLLELGQHAEAIRHLARADELAQQVAAFEPASREARRTVSVMRAAHAQALGLSGQTDAALAVLEANRAALARRLENEQSPQAARDFAYGLTLIGETLHAGGRQAQACAADRTALAQYERLRRSGLLTPFDEANNKAAVEGRIALNCR